MGSQLKEKSVAFVISCRHNYGVSYWAKSGDGFGAYAQAKVFDSQEDAEKEIKQVVNRYFQNIWLSGLHYPNYVVPQIEEAGPYYVYGENGEILAVASSKENLIRVLECEF